MNSFTFFIAAPFGNYLKFSNNKNYPICTSVTGTWTLEYRGGLMKRLWKISSTLSYDRNAKGWVNQLGLPNEGLTQGINKTNQKEVLSIAAIEKMDWTKMGAMLSDDHSVEINLSCPNVDDTEVIWNDLTVFTKSDKRKWCIAKVSPLIVEDQLKFLIEKIGIKQIHLCNTLPLPRGGGLSGPHLKPYVFKLIEIIRKKWGDDIELIAGGGVQRISDVKDYLSAGANHISLGTICFRPWKVNKIIRNKY